MDITTKKEKLAERRPMIDSKNESILLSKKTNVTHASGKCK